MDGGRKLVHWLSDELHKILEWPAGPRPASVNLNFGCLTLREPSQSNSPEPSKIFRCHVFFWWETITWAFPIGRMSLDALNLLPFRLARGDFRVYLSSIYRWHRLFLSTVKLSENRLKPGQFSPLFWRNFWTDFPENDCVSFKYPWNASFQNSPKVRNIFPYPVG